VTPSIGLYTYSTLPRGSVVHAGHLADALHDAGWDVTLYALDKDGRGFFRPLRARLRLVPATPAPSTTAELVRVRATELADYLIKHGVQHDLHHAEDCLVASGLLAARAAGHPVTLARTIHHVEAFTDPYLARCQERSVREAALRFTVSATAQQDVRAHFGLSATIVGNGVDVERFRIVDAGRVAAWRLRLDVAGPIVLAVGGVEERKNTLGLLQGFALLRLRHPTAQLVIVGGATVLDHGAYRAAFEAARTALPDGTRAAVRELGVVADDDVPALYRLADVVALPSLHEGFGLAALEALAAGTPVVVSNRAPFTEFLTPDCATFVDPRSANAIADGLDAALAPTPARRDRGRRVALDHSWARVAARHAVAYERIRSHARDALFGSLA
jgi:glycosyltransferase-like protein